MRRLTQAEAEMRRPIILFLTAGAALLALVLAAAWIYKDRSAAPGPKLEKLQESSPAFRRAEIEALEGSVPAAEALLHYYSGCHERPGFTPVRERRCISKFEYWIRIGLENGSPVAAQRQASAILQTDSCYDVYRAGHWYRKFEKQFRANPSFLKSVSEEIEQKKKGCAW